MDLVAKIASANRYNLAVMTYVWVWLYILSLSLCVFDSFVVTAI